MTDETALLCAICRHPDEDTPRLVYADWLDDHDRPERAEFIRVQCELAKVECPDKRPHNGCTPHTWCRYCESRGPLISREMSLLSAHGNGWDEELHNLIGANEPHYFRFDLIRDRGFIDSITCTAADWIAHADSLYWHPEQTADCPQCKTPRKRIHIYARHGDRFGGDCVEGTYEREAASLRIGDNVEWTAIAANCPGHAHGNGVVRDVTIDYPSGRLHVVVIPTESRCCDTCSGSGRIPRPFPATAQPLTKVRFTTWPELVGYSVIAAKHRMHDVPGIHTAMWWKYLFDAEWPGLEFELPPQEFIFPVGGQPHQFINGRLIGIASDYGRQR